jgi:hypothetical protein
MSFSAENIIGTSANANIYLIPNGTGAVRVDTQSMSVGQSAELLFFKPPNANVAIITTYSRGNGNVGLQIGGPTTGNAAPTGISFHPTNKRMAFGTGVLYDLTAGIDYTFNGELSANTFWAPSNARGYEFYTTSPGNVITGLGHIDDGINPSYVTIRHDSNQVANFYSNHTTIMSGNLVVTTANSVVVSTISSSGLTVNRGNLVITSGNAPATATSQGVVGQVAWDSTHIYVCVSTNTWVRATMATW